MPRGASRRILLCTTNKLGAFPMLKGGLYIVREGKRPDTFAVFVYSNIL